MSNSGLQQVTILGATGSIGDSTLSVLAQHPDKFSVFAVSAHQQWQKLLTICQQFHPQYAVLSDANAASELQQALRDEGSTTQVLAGAEALLQVAADSAVDVVMAAIVGAAGLPSSMAAAKAGKTILLANKESLVVAGDLFMQAVQKHGAILLPVDSEHNALFQSMPADYRCGERAQGVTELMLTASGGPFRNTPLAELQQVTPAQACAHPNWDMGQKISVDSATMMNKGLELIEAHYLFQMPPSDIQVIVHPQSVVHSAVVYADGSWLAQMGAPDMRIPIAHSLGLAVQPAGRLTSGAKPLSITQVATLEFFEPDLGRFACLRLARWACEQGGVMPAVLNAANEVAVSAFLQQQIAFLDIPAIVEQVLEQTVVSTVSSIDDMLSVDALARQQTAVLVERLCG